MSFPIIIIGAGAAGLSAAQEIKNAGKDYLIIEGRDRVGGRVHTLPSPKKFEFGAAWFHNALENELEPLATKHKFESVFDDEIVHIFNPTGELDGDKMGAIGGKFDEFRNSLSADTTLASAREQFAKQLDAEDQKVLNTIAYLFQLTAGISLSELSAHTAAPGGRDKAVQGFQDFVHQVIGKDLNIKLNTKVAKIDTSSGHVVITTTSGDKIEGSAVIVTIPVSVLQKQQVEFVPALPRNLTSAIEKAAITSVEKVYVTFDKPFWDQKVQKFIVSDENGQALIWNWGAAHKNSDYKQTLVVLVCNTNAEKVSANPETAFEVVKPLLQQISSSPIPEPKEVEVSSWIKDEFSLGSYSTVPNKTTREELAQPFIDGVKSQNLFFAGEHATINDAGLVQGAYASGKRAAKQVI